MKAVAHTPAAGQGTTGQRVSRLTQAAVDNRPQAVAQRALQQQVDARVNSPLPVLAATPLETRQGGQSVIQRVVKSNQDWSDIRQRRLERQRAQTSERQKARRFALLSELRNTQAQQPQVQQPQQAQLVPGPQWHQAQEVVLPDPQPQQAQLVPGPQPQQAQLVPGPQPQQAQVVPGPQPQQVQVVPGPQPQQAQVVPGLQGPVQGDSPNLLTQVLTADTPGPTGGLAMLTGLGASTASLGLNINSGYNIAKGALQYLTPFQGAANMLAAAGDAAGMLTEHKKKAGWGEYTLNMAHMGADLFSNVLQAGGYFTAPYNPPFAATMSMLGNGLGVGVQALSTLKAWRSSKRDGDQAPPSRDGFGGAVTSLDLSNNIASTASAYYGQESPLALSKTSAALSFAAPLATTMMTAYRNRKNITDKFGSIKNWTKAKFSDAASYFQNGERQRLLGNQQVNTDLDDLV